MPADLARPPATGPAYSSFPRTAWAAWTAAAAVVAVLLLSTFAFASPDSTGSSSQGSGGVADTSGGAAGDSAGNGTSAAGGGPVTGSTGHTSGSAGHNVTSSTGGKAGRPGTSSGPHSSSPAGSAGTAGSSGSAGSAGAGGAGGAAGAAGGAQCAGGQNGGGTDTGVSATEIKLASTVVKSGIGQAFLGDVEYGMTAVMDKTNRAGGICGRQLSLKLVDDGWDASTGEQDIRDFINEGYFALAVEPSSEGLRGAIQSGDIDSAGIPVVGTDGMLQDQYLDSNVWPVSTSTGSLMHIMAKYAYAQGARSFGLVYDQNYRFGVEGEAAFKGALNRLGGTNLYEYPVQAGQTSYDTSTFNDSCNQCDFVALLLEPDTATAWINSGAYLGTSGKALGAAGPQTLFTYNFGQNFAQDCKGSACQAHFLVWTGFKPPVSPDDADPAVQAYVNDLAATNSSADKYNQFVEGGYTGMELLVQALKQVGPNLSRAALKQVLDQSTFASGLTGGQETWSSGHHFANSSAQAFSLVMSNGAFENFRYENTGWISDPWVGQDLASGS